VKGGRKRRQRRKNGKKWISKGKTKGIWKDEVGRRKKVEERRMERRPEK
jgi:hypothetical protein